ncbi:NADP-dependent oxidoreductase [Brevirhabdus sp.]|uniref:NADP-dependent oxidoreductase n=1 Tax=Brevirhabdus sp. TaxID=2004514 RepID=UPI004058E43A
MSDQLRRIVLASRPQGTPSTDNFRLESGPLPRPQDGQFLARVIWLSLDPYMRGRMDDSKSYAKPVAIGDTMEAACVAEVIDSRNGDFARGDIVMGGFGWSSHALSDGTGVRKIDPAIAPISTALGVLGMPGHTAWVGLNDIAQAQSGETIVVSAATGAVGSLVGQLAKQKGMHVIGVAGGAEKCAFAEKDLQYDLCLDHHALDAEALQKAIAEAAPAGVDVYYENVGGKTLEAVIPAMNVGGRIALCGMIAWYSGKGLADAMPLPRVWRTILTQRLRVQGFIIFDHFDRLPAFLQDVGPMVRDGRVTYRESVAEGLDAAPQAFLDLLEGGNFGKQLVRVGDDPAG